MPYPGIICQHPRAVLSSLKAVFKRFDSIIDAIWLDLLLQAMLRLGAVDLDQQYRGVKDFVGRKASLKHLPLTWFMSENIRLSLALFDFTGAGKPPLSVGR